jgi:hypothetical protein
MKFFTIKYDSQEVTIDLSNVLAVCAPDQTVAEYARITLKAPIGVYSSQSLNGAKTWKFVDMDNLNIPGGQVKEFMNAWTGVMPNEGPYR